MHRLSVHVLGHGERVPMLLDARGLPLFYPTLFATAQLRNAGSAVNTIRNKLADVLVLMRWERAQEPERDLISEFSRSRYLSVADIVSLRDFAARDMRDVAEPLTADRLGIAGTHLLEARVKSSQPLSTIGSQQHYNRLSTIADFVEFVASTVTQHKHSSTDALSIARMANAIRKHRPRGVTQRSGDELSVRSPRTELVDRFIAVGTPGDPRNPFRDPGLQVRNAIIFGLFRHTPIRRGELLSLRIDQLELGHEPRVWVRRNQDDVSDSRRYQPVSKTKERPLPIPQSLADQIQHYIMHVRSRIGSARRHPYLLVSHQSGITSGHPLSLSALSSQIFAAMRSVDPEFAEIHPHAFRHHFNYQLSKQMDRHNAQASSSNKSDQISEAREMDIRAFLNGHRNKASGAFYNRRHVREESDRAIRQLQAELGKNVGKEQESDG